MRRNSGTTVIIGVCTAMLLIASTSAAAKDNVLHSFTGPDGQGIMSGLVSDATGNLYGVAYAGGANGVGSVFKLSRQTGGGWAFSVLYSFMNNCLDGNYPNGTLAFDAEGNLYGTTPYGGPHSTVCNSATPTLGYGTVFELSPPVSGSGSWTETILHNFTSGINNSVDGANPWGGVILDGEGNVYGTTENGGQYGGGQREGTVFELIKDRSWAVDVLHSFNLSSRDGINPTSGLVMDASGNLYGTTTYGGPQSRGGEGVVYKVTPGTGGKATETVLLTFFLNGGAGTNPYGNLIIDADGNLYGTTQGTGVYPLSYESEVFEFQPNGGSFGFKVLHRFQSKGDGLDIISGLVFDSAGNLYGTSYWGGTHSNCPNGPPNNSCGTIFKLTPGTSGAWTEQQLHSFSADGDGFWPQASLIFGPDGNLYGTTFAGGDLAACTPDATLGCGTVFEIAP